MTGTGEQAFTSYMDKQYKYSNNDPSTVVLLLDANGSMCDTLMTLLNRQVRDINIICHQSWVYRILRQAISYNQQISAQSLFCSLLVHRSVNSPVWRRAQREEKQWCALSLNFRASLRILNRYLLERILKSPIIHPTFEGHFIPSPTLCLKNVLPTFTHALSVKTAVQI